MPENRCVIVSPLSAVKALICGRLTEEDLNESFFLVDDGQDSQNASMRAALKAFEADHTSPPVTRNAANNAFHEALARAKREGRHASPTREGVEVAWKQFQIERSVDDVIADLNVWSYDGTTWTPECLHRLFSHVSVCAPLHVISTWL